MFSFPKFSVNRLLKKIRCTLRHFIPLSNLFPSLARRFPFPPPLGLGLWQRFAVCSWKIKN